MSFCLFCSKKNKPLTLFSESTLGKCKSILVVWKKNNLVFNDVLLPEKLEANPMFHRSCYQKFCALPPKYRQCASSSADQSLPASESNDEVQTSKESRYIIIVHFINHSKDNP